MKIPFLDLAAAYSELKNEIDNAVDRVLASGWYILGEEVDAFEREFAEWCGACFGVGVGNGLDALRMALMAVGVEPGDEVIVPSNTYIATWLAVSHCGAIPVPVEPAPGCVNIDPERIEAAITPRTRVILPVHLYGIPAEMEAILSVAHRHGLKVVEDAAQAHGARINGRRIGAHGDAVCWSFYPAKNLGALGDGGAVTTDDEVLAKRLRLLRNYGSQQKYINEVKGFNSRLDPLQAAILREKLKVLDEWNQRRRKIAARYDVALRLPGISRPVIQNNANAAWHLYVIWHKRRDALQQTLRDAGIETLIHYPIPPHLQAAYADLGMLAGSQPVAEAQARCAFSLPIGPHLSNEAVDTVIDVVTSHIYQ